MYWSKSTPYNKYFARYCDLIVFGYCDLIAFVLLHLFNLFNYDLIAFMHLIEL